MGALGAAGLLLRRVREEAGILLLTLVLVAGTSFLLAAAPRAFNLVADEALRHAVGTAPPTQRDVTLAVTTTIQPGEGGGVTAVRDRGGVLARAFPETVTSLIAERTVRVTSPRFLVADPPAFETHLYLRYQDGLTDATTLVAGRWPVDTGARLGPVPPPDGEGEGNGEGTPSPPIEPVVIEAALARAAAEEIGVGIGDRLAVGLDRTDLSVRGLRYELAPTDIEIVGLYEAIDPAADLWAGDNGLIELAQRGSVESPIAWVWAYVPPEAYPNLIASQLPFGYEWRHRIDAARLDADQVAQLQVDLRRLARNGVAGAGGAGTGTVELRTGLPGILDRYAAERSLSESVVSVATIGPFALAGGAIAMVGILAVRRRLRMLALARGRGASGALVLGTQLWEGALVAGSAALAGLLLAMALVPGRPSPLSVAFAVAVAALTLLLLFGASWSAARRPLNTLKREDPPVLRVAPRRLVVELTVVLVAVAASLLLRQRGLVLDEASGVARFDPLLASVPVLGGLAAGIVAIRLYPVPIRALGWLAARRRDIVPVLGLRTIGRHPSVANLPLLVLLLTAAFGAFSSVVASTLAQGQEDASYAAVGTDFRIERGGIGALDPRLDASTVAGVERVATAFVDPAARFSANPLQRSSIVLQAIDAPGYDAVTAGSAAQVAWPGAFLAAPPGGSGDATTPEGIGSIDRPIPAILSARLPAGSGDVGIGNTVRMVVGGQELHLRVVDRRTSIATLGTRPVFAIVPLEWLRAATGRPHPPTVAWLRAPVAATAELQRLVDAQPGPTLLVSRHAFLDSLRGAPFTTVIVAGYWLALGIAAAYMALAVVGAMVLSAERRTKDLAYLRALGFTTPQALGLTFMEHAPPVLLAVLPGIGVGIAVAALCVPGLGLGSFIGTQAGAGIGGAGRADATLAVAVDWSSIAALSALLLVVVAVAIVTGTWLSGRARLVDALRYGDN